jgi:ABC-type branched-subunit amino acid transport system ATPase component
VAGLRKCFGEVTALEGISFRVGRGELFGFLGPNGAGKTTTINILAGLARPDSGTIRVGPLVRFLEEQQVEVFEARRILPSLEEVFVRVTGVEAGAMRKEKEKGGGAG